MREEWPEIERMHMEEGDMRRENEEDWRVKEKECAASCDLENGWWDFRDGDCVCYTDDRSYEGGDYDYEGDYEDSGPYGGDGTSCGSGYEEDGSGGCIPFGTGDYGFEDEPQYDESDYSGDYEEEPPSYDDGGDYSGGDSGSYDSGGDSGSGDSGGSYGNGGSDSGGDSGGGGGGDSGGGDSGGGEVTGSVITGNAFLDYYWN